MIKRDLRLTTNHGIYNIPIRAKYTVVTSASGGSGKSSMFRDDTEEFQEPNAHVTVASTKLALQGACLLPQPVVCIIDEDMYLGLDDVDIERMRDCQQAFLIISRRYSPRLPINYRDVYLLKQSGRYYSCVPRYQPFETFVKAQRYICEDSKSGYLYFDKRLDNVISAQGASNLHKVVHVSDTVIADGATIAPYIKYLVDLGCNLFLPTSFEYLCYEFLNRDVDIDKIVTEWDLSKHSSLEQIFTELLNDYCTKNFGYNYTKKQLPKFLENTPVTDFLRNYVKE